MNEDDTFKALKTWPFESARAHQKEHKLSSIALYNLTGWTTNDIIEEHRRRALIDIEQLVAEKEQQLIEKINGSIYNGVDTYMVTSTHEYVDATDAKREYIIEIKTMFDPSKYK